MRQILKTLNDVANLCHICPPIKNLILRKNRRIKTHKSFRIVIHCMLIEYRVENFRSIAEQTTLSMVTSKERRKAYNLIKVKGVSDITKLLKSSILYGANAPERRIRFGHSI